jgi:predicted GH43/DUF377 family glycosyl hydrolase
MMNGIPSVIEQAREQGWRAQLFEFGNLDADGVRLFNPSIVPRADGPWLVARRSVPRIKPDNWLNDIVAFKLLDGMVIGAKVDVEFPISYENLHFEDPRVSVINGEIYLSCTSLRHADSHWSHGTHQLLGRVNEEWKVVQLVDPIYGYNCSCALTQTGNEKNWLWFGHGGEIHMVYTTVPHQVVEFDSTITAQRTYASSVENLRWNYGLARGGTPPLRIGDEYWSFFHSFIVSKKDRRYSMGRRQYSMGAYAFEARPPFRITRFTTGPLLTGSEYDPAVGWLPLAVFPGGALYRNGKWLIVFGVNDCTSGWVEIPHDNLLTLTHEVVSELCAPSNVIDTWAEEMKLQAPA